MTKLIATYHSKGYTSCNSDCTTTQGSDVVLQGQVGVIRISLVCSNTGDENLE